MAKDERKVTNQMATSRQDVPVTPSFHLGIVKQVLAGDTIVIRDRPTDGYPRERTIILSNISCGKLIRKPTTGNPAGIPEDPFAWQAREYVRCELIGKEVCYSVTCEFSTGKKYGDVYLGKSTSGKNIALSLVEEGLAEVREVSRTVAKKNQLYQQLRAAQEVAKSSKKGRWASNIASQVRNVVWSIEDPRSFLSQYKSKPLKAIVENVRDGSTLQLVLLPESLNDNSNSFVYITLIISGIKAPSIRFEDGQMVSEPLAPDAQFFVESRLLQREVTALLETVSNQNFMGSVLHPNGNIAELLLQQGLARCIDWNLSSVTAPNASESYRAAERMAKTKRLRLWKDYQPTAALENHNPENPNKIIPGKTFMGDICEVGNGDNVSIKCSDGIVRKFFLSSIRAPRSQGNVKEGEEASPQQRGRIRPLYDIPYVLEAREALRRFVGKSATAHVDYIQPKTANTPDERVCVTLTCDGTNLALTLVSDGLASVIRYRNAGDARTAAYADLLAAEESARAKGLGMFSKHDPPVHRIADLTGNLAKSRQFLPFLQRQERLSGIVEFVFSASRLRIYLPRENCAITLLLCGVQCPRKGRTRPDGVIEPDMPFSNQAYLFTKDLCMQKDVDVKVESIDRVGNFVGLLFVETTSGSVGTVNGLEVPKSTGKKKKKSVESVSSKQKTNLSVLLVSHGFATVHRSPATERLSYYSDLLKAEELAKTSRIGLWSSEEFIKQWEAEIVAATDLTAMSGEDGINAISSGGVPEYLDDFSGLQLGDKTVANKENSNPKLNWKVVQVTATSKPVGNKGLRFFAQHVADASTIIQISQILNGQSLPSLPPGYHPKKGDFCAACFSVDNCWYRARVLRCSEESVVVRFIDFGNEENISATEYSSRLSPLPPGPLMTLPSQANEYRLAFVQLPLDSADQLIAERAFNALVENKEVRLAVQFEFVRCDNERLEPVPAVTLLLPVTDVPSSGSSGCSTEVDVGCSLLSDGFVFVEPMHPQVLVRLPPDVIQRYLEAQAQAKKQRKNIWRYGDFRVDLSQQ